MNPFESLKVAFLTYFPDGGDIVFIAGKTTRVGIFLAVLFGIITIRKLIANLMMRSEDQKEAFKKHGNAFAISQAFVFFGTAIALHAPYSKIPYANWELVLSVMVCLLVQVLALMALRLLAAPTHKAMMNGNMAAGVAMGLYTVAAGIGTNAVLNSAL
jgi:uncharacterized membrane protein YjfL (UPF0719 family)